MAVQLFKQPFRALPYFQTWQTSFHPTWALLSSLVNWTIISPNTTVCSHLCEMPSFFMLFFFFLERSRKCCAALFFPYVNNSVGRPSIHPPNHPPPLATSRLISNFACDVISNPLIWNKSILSPSFYYAPIAHSTFVLELDRTAKLDHQCLHVRLIAYSHFVHCSILHRTPLLTWISSLPSESDINQCF